MVENTIQTVSSPIYEFMSTHGNTAKLGTEHGNILEHEPGGGGQPSWKGKKIIFGHH